MIKSFPLLLAATVVLVSPPARSSAPPDIYVDLQSLNCATGTGTAASPVCSIGAAIAIAAPGDRVLIAPGTYFEELVIPIELDLVGTGGADVTIIDGGMNSGTASVVTIPNAVAVTVDGLTIQNGVAPVGGGISFTGSLAIVNSEITNNTAVDAGAGIYANADTAFLTVENSSITLNRCPTGIGGGVSLQQASAEFTNSNVDSNRALEAGGISFTGDSPLLDQLTITNCSVSGNRCSSGRGGGIIHTNGDLTMNASLMINNDANFINALVPWTGGGIVLSDSVFSMTNSTLAGNRAGTTGVGGVGGGIYCEPGATGTISHCTLVLNFVGPGLGAGIGVAPGAGPVMILNTIIARNIGATNNPAVGGDVDGVLMTLGGNLIGEVGNGVLIGLQNDIVGGLGAPIDPMIGDLVGNGGPAQAFALLPGSPAIDAGNFASFELVDQLGVMRIQGAAPDIGAFEARMDSSEICNGDGGNVAGCTSCPCGNDSVAGTIGGCLNSNGLSGQMTRTGSSSVGLSDLRFEALNLPANSVAILLSGSALAPANPGNPCFGLNSGIQATTLDGLRCIVQGVLRHGVRPVDANGAVGATTDAWETQSGLFNFDTFLSGQTRYFQVTYREDLALGCQTGLNTTQASSVTFVP